MLYSELRMIAQQLDFQRTKSCRVLHTAAGMQCHLAAAIAWVKARKLTLREFPAENERCAAPTSSILQSTGCRTYGSCMPGSK
eukprot:19524-Heterococcus_DN1.PRE.1